MFVPVSLVMARTCGVKANDFLERDFDVQNGVGRHNLPNLSQQYRWIGNVFENMAADDEVKRIYLGADFRLD